MESTPIKRFRNGCRNTKLKPKASPAGTALKSPANNKPPAEAEDSPVYIRNTQELAEDVDVIWNYSPQATNRSQKTNKIQKRLLLTHSPKVPMKRHPSNSQIQNFEKFREEMQALREQMAQVGENDCLSLSPGEEADFKDLSSLVNILDDEMDNFDYFPTTPQQIPSEALPDDEVDDIFNDDMDEQLALFTQQVEDTLPISNPVTNQVECSNNNLTEPETRIIRRVNSEVQYTQSSMGKVEFCRTQSFEIAAKKSEIILSKSQLEEIEERRKEALAKLTLRKTQESQHSSMKCSFEEIEKKRLEALAKLKAKQQMEIIENKRQEALKRLEMNRNKKRPLLKQL